MTFVKHCTTCKKDKPATLEFFSRYGDKLQPMCKTCTSEYGKRYREARQSKTQPPVQINSTQQEVKAMPAKPKENMIAIAKNQDSTTMSSREIAKLTGKRHDHVMRDIRKLQSQLGAMFDGSTQTWGHPKNGQIYLEFMLNKDTCLTLLLGYDSVARMKVVKRWQELESKQAAMPLIEVPKTLAQALRLAADQADQIELMTVIVHEQKNVIEVAKPKVEFVDRYVDGSGLVGFRELCKVLGAPEPLFRRMLSQERIMYKSGGNWMPYARYMDKGWFDVKTGATPAGTVYIIAKFTPKGVTNLTEKWSGHALSSW